MKCFVCGKEFAGTEICPCCKETMPDTIGDQEEVRKSLQELGDRIRKEKLEPITLCLTALDMEDGNYAEKDMVVGNAFSLFGTVKWIRKKFYSPVDSGSIEVVLKIQTENRKKPMPILLDVPKNSRMLSLGIGIQEGFVPVIVIKNESGKEKSFTGKSILSI